MSTRESAATAAAIAETDLAEINTATKQSFQQQLRVTTDVGWIWRMNQFFKRQFSHSFGSIFFNC